MKVRLTRGSLFFSMFMVLAWCGLAASFAAGCSETEGHLRQAEPPTNPVSPPRTLAPWPMHAIDSRFRGANALSSGDANRDGRTDYVTNYEFDQRIVVALHPGAGRDPRQPWPTVVAWMPRPLVNGSGVNPEHSTLADFDGDGNLDVAVAQGESSMPFWEGSQPGIRLVWGPPAERVLDEEAWVDGGRIPGTIDRGHLIYVLPLDVNGDGATDIVSGGRIHSGNGTKGGVIWIEAPADRAERRDLAQWVVHDIDPEQFSAHGLVPADIDMDGDMDLVLANADFDTPEQEEKILWYENPGTGRPEQKQPWPAHVIYQGNEFYPKPQVAVGDLDGDGLEDLVTQTDKDIYYFRKTGLAPVTWERTVIRKDPIAQGPSRALKVADIDGDGRQDIFGMLVHDGGVIAGDKASAFWMEWHGRAPGPDNWATHVIKWGSGKPMVLPIFGEKWDQVDITDVDGDGDLDAVANCEEWWEADIEFRFFWDPKVNARSVAVVWFENRVNEAPYRFEERAGVCAIEAEHYTDSKDGTWIERSSFPGYAGNGYMQDHNCKDPANRTWADTGGLEYTVRLQGGSYALWVRRFVPDRWGAFLGGTESNSALIGIDGRPLGDVFDNEGRGVGEWFWAKVPEPLFLEEGTHVLGLKVREGGYAVDRIVLSSVADFTPEGVGPEETAIGP
jgi:hypothetical protein